MRIHAVLTKAFSEHDTYCYWTRRAMHHPKLFRTVHRVHHE